MILSIGHTHFVESGSVVAILRPDSAPSRRLRHGAAETGMLIDATTGRQAKSIIILDSNHVVLSALQPETIISRFKKLMPQEGKRMPPFSV